MKGEQSARIIAYSNMAEYAIAKMREHAQGTTGQETLIREASREMDEHLDVIRMATRARSDVSRSTLRDLSNGDHHGITTFKPLNDSQDG